LRPLVEGQSFFVSESRAVSSICRQPKKTKNKEKGKTKQRKENKEREKTKN